MSNPVIYLFLFLLISVSGVEERKFLRKRDLEVRNECKTLHIEILISPLVSKETGIRRLEIQWEYAPNFQGDWIGLFNKDPLDPSNKGILPEPLDTIKVTETHGWGNTSVLELHNDPENLGFNGRCLNYYAAYFDIYNKTKAVTCLRIEPTWMWNLKGQIGPRKIRNVFIPGTHDSASYGEFNEFIGDTRIKKYSITQDETLLGQLIYGARYIDMRVGYYPKNNEPWWANHGIVRIHPLRVVLKDIKKFIDNTNEIVILDFQEFPVGFGKDYEVHYMLVELIRQELGDYIVPASYNWDSTFDEVWASGKRVIIGYDKRHVVLQYDFLWTAVSHQWGNVQDVDNLYTYLAGVIERPPMHAWSAMAELTPTAVDVILDRLKGLRVMAESVNHNVTEWFRRNDWRPTTNVVAVDFVRNTGIIRSAIEWNKNMGRCNNVH